MIVFMQMYRKKSNWLLGGMAILVGIVLFPYGWLADHWEFFDQVMEALFASEWMHVVGHMVMYGVLATAVLNIYPQLVTEPRHYFAWIFVIGFIQEALQLITFKHHFFTPNEILDLGVDLLAAGIILVAWKVVWRNKETSGMPSNRNYIQ
jgi:hypothetical protein